MCPAGYDGVCAVFEVFREYLDSLDEVLAYCDIFDGNNEWVCVITIRFMAWSSLGNSFNFKYSANALVGSSSVNLKYSQLFAWLFEPFPIPQVNSDGC